MFHDIGWESGNWGLKMAEWLEKVGIVTTTGKDGEFNFPIPSGAGA